MCRFLPGGLRGRAKRGDHRRAGGAPGREPERGLAAGGGGGAEVQDREAGGAEVEGRPVGGAEDQAVHLREAGGRAEFPVVELAGALAAALGPPFRFLWAFMGGLSGARGFRGNRVTRGIRTLGNRVAGGIRTLGNRVAGGIRTLGNRVAGGIRTPLGNRVTRGIRALGNGVAGGIPLHIGEEVPLRVGSYSYAGVFCGGPSISCHSVPQRIGAHSRNGVHPFGISFLFREFWVLSLNHTRHY
jgi:hypothetical protein